LHRNCIFEEVCKTIKKYKTRNPYELLAAVNVDLRESYSYQRLKGYCYIANRSKFVIINGLLTPAEKRIVAAHEAAHLILHKDLIKTAPLRDFTLYDMTSSTEYEANLFTADFLIEDEKINELSDDDGMNYFKMCQILHTSPDLMSFKLFSLIQRGHNYNMPLPIDSKFLGK